MKPITKIIFVFLLISLISSCYDKVDKFEIISNKEYDIEKNNDSTIYIYTKNYNSISKIIIDSELIDVFRLQKDIYILNNPEETELNVKYFEKSQMQDNAEVKSIKSSFFSIEKIESDNPVYKIDIYSNEPVDIHKIELLLTSREDEQSLIFNLK